MQDTSSAEARGRVRGICSFPGGRLRFSGSPRPGRFWRGLLLSLLLISLAWGGAARAQPGAIQTARAAARAYTLVVEAQISRQEFGRAALPVYRRAVALDRRAGNDTLLALHCFYLGHTYAVIGRFDSAAALLRQGLALSTRLGRMEDLIRTADDLLSVYQIQGRPDSAAAIRGRLQALYPRTRPGTARRADLDAILGGYYQDRGEYARALRHRLAVLAYRQQRRDTANLGIALVNVGELFYLQQQPRQALGYQRAGLRWVKLDPDMAASVPLIYSIIGKTYRELGRPDSAVAAYRTALGLMGSGYDDPDATAEVQAELAALLGRQGRLAPAQALMRQALATYAQSSDLDGRARVYYFAGELEAKARNYPAARSYLRRAYTLAQQLKNNDRLEPIARLLAQAEAATGHYAEAYRLREESARLLDSAHAATGQRAMAEMEARYQNRDKQRQISRLDQENRLRAAEAAAQRRAKYLAFGGVGTLLLVVGLIGFLLRQRQRTAALLAGQNAELARLNQRLHGSNAQLAEANQAKAKLFSIISHDLRAPVGNLFQLLELEREAPDLLDEATRRSQTEHLRQTARDLLDTMDELLAWSKDQLDGLDPTPENVDLAPALAELAGLYQPLAQRKNISLTLSCPPALPCRTDANFLRVVLRNLVQNAIKFTPAGGTVALSAEAGAAGRVTLRVADSGPGLDAAQLARLLAPESREGPATSPGHGLGLRLTREFVAKLGGTLTAAPGPAGGTVFTVELG